LSRSQGGVLGTRDIERLGQPLVIFGQRLFVAAAIRPFLLLGDRQKPCTAQQIDMAADRGLGHAHPVGDHIHANAHGSRIGGRLVREFDTGVDKQAQNLKAAFRGKCLDLVSTVWHIFSHIANLQSDYMKGKR